MKSVINDESSIYPLTSENQINQMATISPEIEELLRRQRFGTTGESENVGANNEMLICIGLSSTGSFYEPPNFKAEHMCSIGVIALESDEIKAQGWAQQSLGRLRSFAIRRETGSFCCMRSICCSMIVKATPE